MGLAQDAELIRRDDQFQFGGELLFHQGSIYHIADEVSSGRGGASSPCLKAGDSALAPVELSAKDQDLLRLIRDELVPGGAITTRQRRGYEYHVLAFVSRHMIIDLATLGITAAKSSILQWPDKLPDNYARPFILGLFDGDGFITESGQKAPCFQAGVMMGRCMASQW